MPSLPSGTSKYCETLTMSVTGVASWVFLYFRRGKDWDSKTSAILSGYPGGPYRLSCRGAANVSI